jgi:asparagine synthase (glutamine-hydrolysing)
MCGISGVLSKNSIEVHELVDMNNLISHRGPDDEGYALFDDKSYFIYGGSKTPASVYQSIHSYAPKKDVLEETIDNKATLGFAHRRLAIIDCSEAGHQPMSYDNERYWIVYNGEIYNYLELKKELHQLNYKFYTNTDTEVVLAAYAHWGESCLLRFNGMWAFAIFDQKTQNLFFARDRFGIKPFYYWYGANNTLYFGSEIKQFTAVRGWNAFLNRQRAVDFLNWGLTDHTDETLFKGVYQLRAGYFICLNVQNWQTNSFPFPSKKWYEFKKEIISDSFEDCALSYKEKLFDSILMHLRSDVPIGSCLSGGLDSSSIVAIANNLLKKTKSTIQQKTFSICANDERFNERKWMEEIENNFNLQTHYIYPTLKQLFNNLSEIIWHQDEPFGSTSIYAQWSVFSAASKEGTKVMLDGQGADEQLAGYHEYFAIYLRSLFYAGSWVTFYKELKSLKERHHFTVVRIVTLLASGILPLSIKNRLKKIVNFGKNSYASWLNIYDEISYDYPYGVCNSSPKSIREFSEQQLSKTNLQMLLHWEDRNSMAHSVESRVPFLDYRLVDFTLNLPDSYKISDGITKRILRVAMKNILPPKIINRMDKMGFVTPEELWMTKDNPDLFREKLKKVPLNSCGLINHNIQVELENMINGKCKFDFRIWRAICFSEWVNCFSVKLK